MLGLWLLLLVLSFSPFPNPTNPPTSAMTAGAAASFLACPVEVCLVRMQADGKLPKAEQRGYKHVGDALVRVAREEGRWVD